MTMTSARPRLIALAVLVAICLTSFACAAEGDSEIPPTLVTDAATTDQAKALAAVRTMALASFAAGQRQTSTSIMDLGAIDVISANDEKMSVTSTAKAAQQIEMTLTWKSMKPRDVVEIACGLLPKQDVESHLKIAVFALVLGQGSVVDPALERLQYAVPNAAATIADMRKRIADQTPRQVKSDTPPAPAKVKPAVEKGRVNHAGRQLPKLPPFKQPILFNTPEADVILSAMQIFPINNAWNENIAKRPVHPDSAKIIASVGSQKAVSCEYGSNFIIIPPNQPKIAVTLASAEESDPGPYPMPDNAPIEGWPEFWTPNAPSLEAIQRVGEGDRHVVLVDPFNHMLYEFCSTRRTDKGWTASNMATWDLKSNKLRPKDWTSADAAGLPMFPGYIRYDEFERGTIEHAIRLTVAKTRPAYIYPATHKAGLSADPNSPAMGERFRLKASYDVSKLSKPAQIVATAMKTYGMIVADNGTDWAMCLTSDSRINDTAMRELRVITGADLEVVLTTGENEGPRAPAR